MQENTIDDNHLGKSILPPTNNISCPSNGTGTGTGTPPMIHKTVNGNQKKEHDDNYEYHDNNDVCQLKQSASSTSSVEIGSCNNNHCSYSSEEEITNSPHLVSQNTHNGGIKNNTDTYCNHEMNNISHKDSSIHTHYIFLVHGWLGQPKEMKSVEQSVYDRIKSYNYNGNDNGNTNDNFSNSSDNTRVEVYCSAYNTGKTNDGVASGGQRLANEIEDIILNDIQSNYHIFNNPIVPPPSSQNHRNKGLMDNNQKQEKEEYHVTLSLLGNSLGGLYSRYAIKCLPSYLEIQVSSTSIIVHLHFNTFMTTVSPHLGLLSTKRRFKSIAKMFGKSGCDLYLTPTNEKKKCNNFFRCFMKKSTRSTNKTHTTTSNHDDNAPSSPSSTEEDYGLLFQMATNYQTFLKPLSKFQHRVLCANSFKNDFQVPTPTAAFLSKRSTYPHYILQQQGNDVDQTGTSFVVTTCMTQRNDSILQQSVNLDSIQCAKSIKEEIKAKDLIMSNKLDSLGWTKVFVDTRHLNPIKSSVPLMCRQSSRELWKNFVSERESQHSMSTRHNSMEQGSKPISLIKGTYQVLEQVTSDNRIDAVEIEEDLDVDDARAKATNVSCIAEVNSKDLFVYMNKNERILQIPFGHSIVVANAKSDTMEKLNCGGKPVVDYMTSKFVEQVFQFQFKKK